MATELEGLIHFWKEHLFHNQHIMTPSIIWQVEQTIKGLEELKKLKEVNSYAKTD